MSTKAIQKHAGGLVATAEGVVVQNNEIVQTNEFIEALELAKTLQNVVDDFWATLRVRMQDEKVTHVKGDWGYVTLNPVRLLSISETTAPRFTKRTADTTKIRAWQTLHAGVLPEGVSEKLTVRLDKKIKL